MSKTILLPVELDLEALVHDLAQAMSYEEAFKFMVNLDVAMADWTFTKEIAAFFINEVLKEWADQDEEVFEVHAFIKKYLPDSV